MTSILTGDIINSRNVPSTEWLPLIKAAFNTIGKSPKTWEIYRGDSFQIEVPVLDALITCLTIKANQNHNIDDHH